MIIIDRLTKTNLTTLIQYYGLYPEARFKPVSI